MPYDVEPHTGQRHRLPGTVAARPAPEAPLATRSSRRAEGAYAAGSGAPRTRQAARLHRAHEVRRALLLTGVSTVIPGLGLTFTRRRRTGLLILAVTVIAGAYMVHKALNGGIIHGAAGFLTKRGLWTLLGIFVVGGLVWILGIALTARETVGRRWPEQSKWLLRLFAAAMCMIVAVPTAVATRYVTVTQDAFSTIFQKRTGGEAVNKPKGGSDPWADTDRVNLMMVGSDAGADRTGIRTDSLMVISINPKTGDTTLVGIPRNLERVPFPTTNPLHAIYPDGFICKPGRSAADPCIMDAVWAEAAVNHPDLFKGDSDPGLTTTRDVVQEITGLKIDYSTVVDLSGFQQLVDAMGGVYVNVVPSANSQYKGIPIGGKVVNGRVVGVTGLIKPGYQKLNGYQALWYSRSRVGASDGDFDRMRRQKCMVNALVGQANPFSMLTKFTGIMSAAKSNITTDVPQDDLPAFATLVDRMKKGNFHSVTLSDSTGIHSADPNFTLIRSLVSQAIAIPHSTSKPTPSGSSASPSTPSSASSSTSSSPTSAPTSVSAISDTSASC